MNWGWSWIFFGWALFDVRNRNENATCSLQVLQWLDGSPLTMISVDIFHVFSSCQVEYLQYIYCIYIYIHITLQKILFPLHVHIFPSACSTSTSTPKNNLTGNGSKKHHLGFAGSMLGKSSKNILPNDGFQKVMIYHPWNHQQNKSKKIKR